MIKKNPHAIYRPISVQYKSICDWDLPSDFFPFIIFFFAICRLCLAYWFCPSLSYCTSDPCVNLQWLQQVEIERFGVRARWKYAKWWWLGYLICKLELHILHWKYASFNWADIVNIICIIDYLIKRYAYYILFNVFKTNCLFECTDFGKVCPSLWFFALLKLKFNTKKSHQGVMRIIIDIL